MQWLLYNYTESCLCVCIRESFCVWMCVCLSIYLSVFLSIYHSFSLSIIIHSFYIFLYYRRPTLVVKTAWKPDIKRGPPRCHRQGLPPPLTTAGLVYPPPPFNGLSILYKTWLIQKYCPVIKTVKVKVLLIDFLCYFHIKKKTLHFREDVL